MHTYSIIKDAVKYSRKNIQEMTWELQQGTERMLDDMQWLIDRLEEAKALLEIESTDNIAIQELLETLKE